MKTFIEYVKEEGEGSVPANVTGVNIAGTTGEPPVKKREQENYKKQNIILKRKSLQK